jgi:hypothetical protein
MGRRKEMAPTEAVGLTIDGSKEAKTIILVVLVIRADHNDSARGGLGILVSEK